MELQDQRVLVTGATAGIGREAAKLFARRGASVVITGRDTERGAQTVAAIEAEGGRAEFIAADLNEIKSVRRLAEQAGDVDVLVNNAASLTAAPTLEQDVESFEIMFDVNVRGTFVCSQACLPLLQRSAAEGRGPHILNLSPPMSLRPRWFAPHVAYTMAKYGMSMCVLGMSDELRPFGIGVNALWPRTLIATAALQVVSFADIRRARTPDIVADAAHAILVRDPRTCTGNFYLDEDVLREKGVEDFSRYAVTPANQELLPDLFVD